jgi:hypothetical protein
MSDRDLDNPERPDAEAILASYYAQRLAVLMVGFTPLTSRYAELGIGPVYLRLERAWSVLTDVLPESVRIRDRRGMHAVFASPSAALLAGLEVQRRLEHGIAGVGLAFGDVWEGEYFGVIGAPAEQAAMLADRVARHGDVLATRPFLAALGELPVGVGSYVATPEQEKEAGFPFHVLRDWRD